MIDVVGIGQALRAAFAAPFALDPLMHATIARLYGSDNAARLDAAVAAAGDTQEPHGVGDALLYEYDPAEQARFEAECARDAAGSDEE